MEGTNEKMNLVSHCPLELVVKCDFLDVFTYCMYQKVRGKAHGNIYVTRPFPIFFYLFLVTLMHCCSLFLASRYDMPGRKGLTYSRHPNRGQNPAAATSRLYTGGDHGHRPSGSVVEPKNDVVPRRNGALYN